MSIALAKHWTLARLFAVISVEWYDAQQMLSSIHELASLIQENSSSCTNAWVKGLPCAHYVSEMVH